MMLRVVLCCESDKNDRQKTDGLQFLKVIGII